MLFPCSKGLSGLRKRWNIVFFECCCEGRLSGEINLLSLSWFSRSLLLCSADLTCRDSPDELSETPVWQTDQGTLIHVRKHATNKDAKQHEAHKELMRHKNRHKHLSTPGMTHYQPGQDSGGELMPPHSPSPSPCLFPLMLLLFSQYSQQRVGAWLSRYPPTAHLLQHTNMMCPCGHLTEYCPSLC